jgi:hypothetical protein
MLAVLISVGNFYHQTIPIVLKQVDSLLLSEAEKQKFPLIHNHDFVILQLLEYLDAFDKNKSEYTIEYDENLLGEQVESIRIKKMVLKEPVNGFPPIFRVKEKVFPYMYQ